MGSLTIQLDNVTTSREGKEILVDLSCEIKESPTIIMGANGSGKSTLLQSIGGLLPYSGTLTINNNEVSGTSKKALAQMVSFVPQIFYSSSKLSVLEFVMLGRFPHLSWMGQFQTEDHEITQQNLQKLGIAHLSKKEIGKISGGEFQKVLIARALSQESPIILMDEPTQSLDPKQKHNLYELLSDLCLSGKLILVVSHELFPSEPTNPHILALKDKGIWFHGPQHELPDNWEHLLY